LSHKRPRLLKKSLSDLWVVQNSTETMPKHCETGFSALETGVRTGPEGVFQHAGTFLVLLKGSSNPFLFELVPHR
jgi:hypothetical protein